MATFFTSVTPRGRRAMVAGLVLAAAAGILAPTFGATSATWDRLAQCESGQRWDANTGNGYYGGLQFSSGTWLAYDGDQFAKRADLATRVQQITVAERLLADRGWGPWPACSTKLKLTAADAVGSPFPALPSPSPSAPTPTPGPGGPAPTPSPAPTTSAPPTADAAAVLAAAQRKATNTAARTAKKQAEYDAAKLKFDRAVRNARKAPPEQWASRQPKVTRLQNAANTAAAALTQAKADADRAQRKLRAAQAAAGVAP